MQTWTNMDRYSRVTSASNSEYLKMSLDTKQFFTHSDYNE